MVFVLAVVVWTLCVAWVALAVSALVSARSLTLFDDLPIAETPEWPRLSVIVPACNEADTITEAMRSLMAQDYPNLELIVIDDRSTDETGALIDALAGGDPRVVPVHVESLPEGWLGKLNAMNVGVQRATGDLLLFTDADVHYVPDALRRAVSGMESEQLDHLTIFPSVLSSSLALDACVAAFGTLLLAAVRPHRMRDPKSNAVLGVGAFNMVRTSKFEETPGLEWLRMEIADDTGLALMMRRAGARQDAWLSRGALKLEWYPSVGALIAGLEKNMFGVAARYSVANALLRGAALVGFAVAPFVGLALPPGTYGYVASLVALGSVAVLGIVTARHMGRSVVTPMLLPLALLVFVWAVLRSTYYVTRNDGVTWRGTHYPLQQLRDLQRFEL